MAKLQIALLAVFVACATAFAPVSNSPTRVRSVQMAAAPKEEEPVMRERVAQVAAFTTALAPVAAQAADVSDGTVIAYGAGLVACVVSLAVGFTIGYGTLTKL